jgi:hypothetical protein
MRSTYRATLLRAAALAGAALLLTAGSSSAATVDVYLQTQSYSKALPGGATVPMWRFICDPGAGSNPNCAPSASGSPRIEIAADDSLWIHLTNTLPTPVSVTIPGKPGETITPTWTYDAQGRRRVQSFTDETTAGSVATPSAEVVYKWNSLRPGTYLYQSGTHPSIQVPMGLFGALLVGPATGVTCGTGQPAYDNLNSCHDAEVLLLFSEIDPVQHAAVDAAAGVVADYPRSIDYSPKYFLINGEPFDRTTPPAALPAGDPGDSVLLRFLNAGLRSHIPVVVGLDVALIAEDGNPYPGLAKQQSAALLPAGKTLDAVVAMPAVDATYPLYDRMLDLTNDNQPDGGMLAYLQLGTGSAPPPTSNPAVDDIYSVTEDTPFATSLSCGTAPEGVLCNDTGLLGAAVVTGPANGTLTLSADGSFIYTPNADFSGSDGFTYSASDGANTYAAQVTLNVSFENDGPVAADDGPYVNAIGPDITVAAPGVLSNDADPDGDALTAALDVPPGIGTVSLLPDGSFTYTGGTPGSTVIFSYHATDGSSPSAPATVTLNINPVADIALNVQDPGGSAVTSYRWLLQEDATYHINPAAPPPTDATLSTGFHKSYMPVVAQGCVGAECNPENENVPVAAFDQVALDPLKHYYVSVLPNDAGTGEGHSIGGAQILPGTASSTVQVIVNNQPVPTAQISVFVFEDNFPTNGAPDPSEPGLGGFQIILEDAGGRYGISGGTMSQDGFGNPLKNSLDCFGVTPPPEGVILTCPDGTALIKNLPPGKYGVIAVAPAGGTDVWSQTSTIEGTKVQDTWVIAGEPPFLVEFGAPGYHAFIGFVNPEHTTVPPGPPGQQTGTISGNVTMVHPARPPSQVAFDSGTYDALVHTRAWVGLNSAAGTGANIATVQAEPDGHFTMEGIPDGTYQLVIWDTYLDQIIHYRTVILPGGGDVGNIPVPTWFGRQEHNVFLDSNGDGIRQEGEVGLPEQAVNLRFRDGTVFQSFPTDTEGFVPFDQIFPFGSWQVAEVDYTRFKATGVTVTVDGGGDVSGGPHPGLLNPQVGTPRTDTEPAPVLLQGFQSMPGMTSVFEWGKRPYAPGENGGISGIVFYGATRGENDPRLTVGDPWEPGIPNVKVRLYREVPTSGGGTALALVQEVQTDSWDAATPTGCEGEAADDPFVTQTLNGDRTRCFDGVRNFEQVRPGALFDGGYAFGDIPPGKYVVEVVPPPGYELIKEEDKNVDFGDSFETLAPLLMMLPGGGMVASMPDQAMVLEAMGAEPGLAQPPCVGPLHEVPMQLSLFPGVDTYAPFAGALRPLCNRKEVILSDQGQAAADFHLFTSTPVAGQFQGLSTDDIAVETNPASPSFPDKWGPAFLPISMRDFNGHEIYRGYSDAFGRYNGVLPSTFTANIPIPSGYSPGMHFVCLNDPGPIPGPGGTPILDPQRNPNYGIFCYTLMYMPGTTTYLDTPLLPNAAFAAGFNPADCAFADATPVIEQVDGTGTGPLVAPGGTLTIQSQGVTSVPNPAYEGPLTTAGAPYDQPTIERDYGFGGDAGSVTLNGTALENISWSDGQITGTIPGSLPPGTYQLVVTRANGKSSINTVTVTVGTETPVLVTPGPGAIQAAIDAAAPGALVLVAPGVYDELVVLWRPVRLQGSGAATIINAVKRPTEKLANWRTKVKGLIDAGTVDLLPGQPGPEFDLVGVGLFGTELGAGITVLAKNDGSFLTFPSRIDGFTISGADGGGGIFVNGYAHNLQISNNYVTGNSGILHGGIRVGHPSLPLIGDGPFNFNSNLSIHHNAITRNGSLQDRGAGGGVALCAGSDDYLVAHNFVCGNFNLGDGGGIGHLGLSTPGRIEFNQVLFNQTYNQGLNRGGGGIAIAGEPPVAPAALTLGAGNVAVDANLIQGNEAGTGHGGGIRTQRVNGRDVALSNQESDWYHVTITNNMIVNNVAAWSGGGISLQDTAVSEIRFNTIANNDSTATVGAAFDEPNTTTPQPAGISSERHSLALDAVIPGEAQSRRNFSNPDLTQNIVWHNRSFYYDSTVSPPQLLPVLAQTAVGDCPAGADYWDLGVLDPGFELKPQFSILTVATGNNISADPEFLSEYCNGARSLRVPGGGTTMSVASEVAEGGNFISVRYGPLTPTGNYHLAETSPAVNPCASGPPAGVSHDFDNEIRPSSQPDWGADEVPLPLQGVVSYSSGAFGGVLIGTTSTLTITATVSVAPVTFTSSTDPAAPFAKIADTCSGTTVPVGGTCTFTVTYSPTSGITSSGSFTVTNDALCSPQTVTLSGSGIGGTVAFSSGAFGNVTIGRTATLTITATVSVAPVTFTSSTDPAAPFAKTADTCSGTTVPIGGSCTFTVTYSPTSTATSNGSFTVTDDGLGSPQTVTLSGTGVRQVAFTSQITSSNPQATLTSTVSGGTLAFGNRNSTVFSTLTITISGDSPAGVKFDPAPTIQNTTGAAFSIVQSDQGPNPCWGATINPGGTCTIRVFFAGPPGNQARTGTLTVPHNGAFSPNPLILNLNGN